MAGGAAVNVDMLAELAHLFFLESWGARSERERKRLLRVSRELATQAIRGGR